MAHENDDEDYETRELEALRQAIKKYNRKKTARQVMFWVAFVIAGGVPVWFDFSRTDYLVWYLILWCALLFETTRKHIRAIQIRLAMMADQLNHVAGREPENYTLDELSEA
jgi:hypothetical protein